MDGNLGSNLSQSGINGRSNVIYLQPKFINVENGKLKMDVHYTIVYTYVVRAIIMGIRDMCIYLMIVPSETELLC